MQLATLITQNHRIFTARGIAPCRMDMGNDEFYSYTDKSFFTVLHNDRFRGSLWFGMTI